MKYKAQVDRRKARRKKIEEDREKGRLIRYQNKLKRHKKG